jgi:hypothetical protein
MSAPVSYHLEGDVGVITVDNPPVNALSHAVRKGLLDSISAAQCDDSRAILIICGGRTFIAGADITEFDKPFQEPGLPDVLNTIEASNKLVVAAIHGTALGGGLETALSAHYRCAIASAKVGLPEVKLGRWGRYLFINPDPDCEPLEDFVGSLSSEFEFFPYERRYKEAHVAKIIRANWKVVQEAFMESYHVFMTHPQALGHGAHDGDTKYDVFGNYSRAILCGALDGAGIPDWGEPPEQDGDVTRIRHPLTGTIYESAGDGVVQVTTRDGRSGKFDRLATWIEGDTIDANPHMCIVVAGVQLPEAGVAGVQTGSIDMASVRMKLGV